MFDVIHLRTRGYRCEQEGRRSSAHAKGQKDWRSSSTPAEGQEWNISSPAPAQPHDPTNTETRNFRCCDATLRLVMFRATDSAIKFVLLRHTETGTQAVRIKDLKVDRDPYDNMSCCLSQILSVFFFFLQEQNHNNTMCLKGNYLQYRLLLYLVLFSTKVFSWL